MIRVGTRASALARAQTSSVVDALRRSGTDVEVVPITTTGDRSQADNAPVPALGGVGVFVSELREALLDGRVDVAVHSYKDLPIGDVEGLHLAAVPAREDARDVLVARHGLRLAELPYGATVGTGSTRRSAQVAALGLGLELVPIRGNVDRRLEQVASGDLDAVVLARAGLARLDRLDEVTEVLDPLLMLPAPAQGALACECRDADPETAQLLRTALHDPATAAAVGAERAVLSELGWDCSSTVGSMGIIGEEDRVTLRAFATTTDGRPIRATLTGRTTSAVQLGRDLAQELIVRGAMPTRPATALDDEQSPHSAEVIARAIDDGYESWLG